MSGLFTSPHLGRRQWVLGAAALLAGPAVRAQASSAYPNRPVTWMVPYAAGGAGDTLAA